MSPKKRAPKKAKKAARAKKLARGKKLATKKKPAQKKKLVARKKTVIKKKAGRKAGPGVATSAARHKGDQHRAAPATGGLGEWIEDTKDQDRPASLLDDDDLLAPDYGGSK